MSVGFAAAKILTGLLYTFIMIRFIPSAKADIDLFFGDGLEMYHRFWQDPSAFPAYLKEIFTITDFRLGNTDSDFIRTVFDGIKFIHFLLDFLSGGHIYTNVLLFNGLAAWLFLRCWVYLKKIFGHPWLGNWVFLFPSAFFFTSVILKEGIELILMAVLIPALSNLQKGRYFFKLVGVIILFGLMFFFKYLIAATFAMVLFLFLVFKKFPGKSLVTSLIFFLALGGFFLGAGYIFPSLDFPNYIIERRMEFLELEANTELAMKDLEPTLRSFIYVFPEALYNVMLRPVPGEIEKPYYYFFMFELYGFWALILYAIFSKRRSLKLHSPGPEAIAFLIFAIINLIIIGYTITNTGAIIRYRSIFLPAIGYFFWSWLYGKHYADEGFRIFPFRSDIFPSKKLKKQGKEQ